VGGELEFAPDNWLFAWLALTRIETERLRTRVQTQSIDFSRELIYEGFFTPPIEYASPISRERARWVIPGGLGFCGLFPG
jgi:hypothetical protein